MQTAKLRDIVITLCYSLHANRFSIASHISIRSNINIIGKTGLSIGYGGYGTGDKVRDFQLFKGIGNDD